MRRPSCMRRLRAVSRWTRWKDSTWSSPARSWHKNIGRTKAALKRYCVFHLRGAWRLFPWPWRQKRCQHQLLEFRREALDHLIGIGTEPAIGDDAEPNFAVVRQNRDAQPDIARLRHPEHHAADERTTEVQWLLRTWHIGHY